MQAGYDASPRKRIVMEENVSRLIIVLGMHRSGTSVITSGLQVMGVDLGANLMPASEGNNSRGFWEDVDINRLNIEMLHFLEIDWHFLTPVQPADVDTLCKNGYLQRAQQILQEKTTAKKRFGIKDPRIAKLLPFWKEVFAHSQISADYVLVIRHPLSVGSSLAKRDGFDFEKSHLLWLEHVIGSLVGTQGENRVLVDYDLFMQIPEAELTRIAKQLGLAIDAAELQRFQQEFLDPELQHSLYQLDDLARESTSPPLLQEVYSTLLEYTAGHLSLEDPALKKKILQWDREFARLRSTLMFIDKLGLRISAADAERNVWKTERKALLQEKAQLTQAFTVKEQAMEKLRAELLVIYQSRLWHWTKPVRKLLDLFHRRTGSG
jgi:O-antigen biosynthesis protein